MNSCFVLQLIVTSTLDKVVCHLHYVEFGDLCNNICVVSV